MIGDVKVHPDLRVAPTLRNYAPRGGETMLQSLGQILPHAAQRYGDRTALIIGERSFSFRELDALSNRFAHGLVGLGVEPGDRVTLYAENRWEWVVAYHGILKTGAVVNPINVMLTPAEVEFVAKDCEAKALVASFEKAQPILDIADRTPLAALIVFGREAPAPAVSFEQLLEAGSESFDPIVTGFEKLSTIGYTSGTTGTPKGAMLSHRAILLNIAMTAQVFGRGPDDTMVNGLPLPHVYGNVILNGGLWFGGKLVLLERFDPGLALAAIEEHRGTIFEGVPTMYMYMLDHPTLPDRDLSSLTRCTVGGQTMPAAKARAVEARFGCELLELWGMTELGGLGTAHPSYGMNRHGSIGVPIPYVECRIADAEDASRDLPKNTVGELMVRGPIVMEGYFGNEAATREAIEPDGWLHTGDVARMDEEGLIYIVDRKKDMILTAGHNVYPAEIERVVSAHPAVALVAVGKVDDEVKGELAKAYVVLGQGQTATEAEILAHCRNSLAAYKVPRAVKFVDDLPKTSTGKLLRRELSTLD